MSKDKNWLKEKVEEMHTHYSMSNNLDFVSKRQAIDEFKCLLDQLHDPVEAIKEYFKSAEKAKEILEELGYVVSEKPTKPIIPQFVADWIEKWKKEGLTMHEWFSFDFNDEDEDKVAKWLYDNDYEENTRREYLLIDAIRYGYEVEKEKKYYVDLDTAAYVAKWNGDNQVGIYTDGISGSDEFEFYLTEKEIKDYDKRFWVFAEEVTE